MTKKEEKKKTKDEKTEEKKEFLPPLDFSSVVLPFYIQALVKLGQAEDPISKKKEENLDLARRLIDILDLLKERTKGNLNPEEEKLLASSLQQLKIAYMEKTETSKL